MDRLRAILAGLSTKEILAFVIALFSDWQHSVMPARESGHISNRRSSSTNEKPDLLRSRKHSPRRMRQRNGLNFQNRRQRN
jgi:hypothetical protein